MAKQPGLAEAHLLSNHCKKTKPNKKHINGLHILFRGTAQLSEAFLSSREESAECQDPFSQRRTGKCICPDGGTKKLLNCVDGA